MKRSIIFLASLGVTLLITGCDQPTPRQAKYERCEYRHPFNWEVYQEGKFRGFNYTTKTVGTRPETEAACVQNLLSIDSFKRHSDNPQRKAERWCKKATHCKEVVTY